MAFSLILVVTDCVLEMLMYTNYVTKPRLKINVRELITCRMCCHMVRQFYSSRSIISEVDCRMVTKYM